MLFRSAGFLLQYEANRKMEFVIFSGVGGANSGITPTAGQWYHLVGTYNHSYIRFYTDGVLKKETAATASIASATTLRFGNEYQRSYNLKGLIDEVRIYNYARSADEIRQDYNEGMALRFGEDGNFASLMTKGLVGYWAMDEGGGSYAYDGSGNNNTGTLYNGPAWTTGKVGGALQFDGVDDYVDAGNKSVYGTAQKSLELWFKASSLSGTQALLSREGFGGGGIQYGYDFKAMNTDLRFSIADETKNVCLKTMPDLVVDQWYHAVATHDGSYTRLFVNGAEIGTPSTCTGYTDESTSLMIGRRSLTAIWLFNGLIDEVRIYAEALPSAEIQKHYVQGLNKLLANNAITEEEYNQRMAKTEQLLTFDH